MSIKSKVIKGIRVSLDFAECPDDGGKYKLLCEKHGWLIQDDNKARLWSHANNVFDWCEVHGDEVVDQLGKADN